MAIVKQTWDLELDYGINWKDSRGYLKDKYTAVQAQAKYQYLWAWGKFNGWTDAELLSLSEFVAAWNDVIWHMADGQYGQTAVLGHGWKIIAPHGKFPINYSLVIAGGEYIGQGSRIFYSNFDHGFGGTELWVDHNNWLTSKMKDRHIMRTSTWGGESMYAYQESFKIRGFRLEGNRQSGWMIPDYESSGVAVWESGETARLDDLYCYRFNNDGLLFVRGTPAFATNISLFMCNRSGIAMIGGAGATYTFMNISGDDCPATFYARDGYGRTGGCLLTAIGVKSETGLTDQFKPWKGQMLLDGEGWVVAVINGVSLASGWVYPDAMVRVKHTSNVSSVEISGIRLFGSRRTILHDAFNDKKWYFNTGSWTNVYTSMYWISVDGGVLTTKHGTPSVANVTYKERLGYLNSDPVTGQPVGVFDDNAGLPAFSYTGTSTGTTGSITSISASANPLVVNEGATSTLSASVQGTGTFNGGVLWAIVSGGGTLSTTSGAQTVYTAPQVSADSTAVIRATATGDATKTSSVQLVVKNIATTPPVGGTSPKWASSFDGTGPALVATIGANISPSQPWSNGSFSNGTLTSNGNMSYPWTPGIPVSKITLKGVTFLTAGSFNYSRINSHHTIKPDGTVVSVNLNGTGEWNTGVKLVKGQRYASLDIPFPTGGVTLTSVIGGPLGTGSSCLMTIEGMEVYG